MNVRDLKVGMVVACNIHDPHYYPVKGRVVGLNDSHSSYESVTEKQNAHSVEILNGVHQGRTLHLVGRRILRQWGQNDEAAHQELKNFLFKSHMEAAKKKEAEQHNVDSMDKAVIQLKRLGITAARGRHSLPTRLERSEAAIVVFDGEKLLNIIETYMMQNILDLDIQKKEI